MASEMLDGAVDMPQVKGELKSEKITFHGCEDTTSTRTSRDSINLIHGFKSAPSWRERLKSRKTVVGLILFGFIAIIVVATAISVPLAVKAKAEWKASTAPVTVQVNSTIAVNVTTTFQTKTNESITTAITTTPSEVTSMPAGAAQLVADGWYPVHYSGHVYLYKISADKAAYTDAKRRCVRAGAALAAVGLRVPKLRNTIYSGMVFPHSARLYIGLDDLSSKHTWRWIDGVISTRHNTNWMPNEPNGDRERCGEIERSRDFEVNDFPCNQELHYLCEKIF